MKLRMMFPPRISGLIAGVMDNVWGTLTDKDWNRLEVLIGEWALKDPDAALAWARNLRQPQQRSAGLCCIAAALAETDPHRAFEIYAEQETVFLGLGREKILKMVTKLSQDAIKDGPQALMELWRRIPQNGTNGTMGFDLSYPDDFDYAGMMDLMSEEGMGLYKPSGKSNDKPIEPQSPLAEWAVREPSAAFDYILDKFEDGMRLDGYWSLTNKMKEKWGNEATQNWIGEQVAGMDPTQRAAFMKGTMMLNYPGQLKNMIDHIPDSSVAQQVRYETMQSGIPNGPGNFEILADLPTNEKLEVIGKLRGFQDTAYLEKMLNTWDVPNGQIESILKQATRPVEDPND